MPTSTSQQNNYYATHHRRGSQLSLASNGDQTDITRPFQSPNRSLVYLPASTYTQPIHSRDESLSMPRSPPVPNGNILRSQLDGQSSPVRQSPDPRFWSQSRQYPFPDTQEGLQNGTSLPKLRSNGQSSAQSSSRRGSVEASRSTPALNTSIRQRTASIKELVAKFDSPTDEIPPVPSRPGSRVNSRATSPTFITSNSTRRPSRTSDFETNDQYSTWLGRRAKTPSGTRRSVSQTQATEPMPSVPPTPPHAEQVVNTQDFDPYRKPLFGELLPQASAFLGGPGYGISSPKRRRGSEGSPMHSPNPMFPLSADSEFASPISPTAWYRDAKVENALHSSALTSHRRAQSDMTETPVNRRLPQSAINPPTRLPQMVSAPASATSSGARRASHSKIPIHRNQQSTGSGSTISPPSSRAPSTQGLYPTSRGTPQSIPKVVLPTTTKSSTAKRKPVTPTHIQSPNRRTPIPQSEKSPSLRANIIIPPPKISPPLRSSRPRQPVSAASTAASRAKMAEKFEKAQRNNSERSTSSRSRARPKELKNVDLEARRKNITQALDRLNQKSSRESQIDRNDRDTPTLGYSRSPVDDVPQQEHTPNPVVTEPHSEDMHSYVDDDSTPEAGITQMPGGFPNDSPTFATEPQSLRVDVNAKPEMQDDHVPDSAVSYLRPLAFAPKESEPNSAVTTNTDATIIDAEPQAPFTRPKSPHRTILSQVMGLRQPSPLSPSSASCSESGGNVSDHADEESVQIMLRNTRYLNDSPILHHPYEGQYTQSEYPDTPDIGSNGRNSWTSSIPDDGLEDDRLEAIQEASPDPQRRTQIYEAPMSPEYRRPASAIRRRDVEPLDSLRSTMASDAYTVVDFVLQQNSSSGVVRTETVDDMTQRVLQQSPRHMYQRTFDRDRVEELTLQHLEMQRYNLDEAAVTELDQTGDHNGASPQKRHDSQLTTTKRISHAFSIYPEDSPYLSTNDSVQSNVPSQPSHQYGSSRGSEADWVTPYPVAHELSSEAEVQETAHSQTTEEPSTARASTFPLSKSNTEPDIRHDEDSDSTQGLGLSMRVTSPVSLPWDGYMVPRVPSHSPPPPPPAVQSLEDITTRFAQSGPITLTPKGLPPQIPRRITSQSQMNQHRSRAPSIAPSFTSVTAVGSRQSSEQQNLSEDEKKAVETQKRLKQRRHIIKELVDTEITFERDMKVVVDIYQATAEPIASKADLVAIFANSEEVVQFSRNFGTQLKNTAKPVYDKSRTGRSSSAQPSLTRSSSYASTLDGEKDLSESDRDRQTRIGDVFLNSAAEMEAVYAEYMMKQDAANKKAQTVLQTDKGKLWTQMCHNESRDLTSAWDLPSLLVKPVQRAMKYKLFLDDLLKSTPADHPDQDALKRACEVVEGMMVRINNAKKHNELVESAMGRKRKESNASKGFTLTKINRGTEKLKQNMGLAEAYEDAEYTKLFREFDERLVYFMTVIVPDQDNYRASLSAWMDKLCRIAEYCDSWVDVQPTKHMEMESKLRHFSQAARSIRRVGIEPHLLQIDREVFEPIRAAFKMLIDFKQDPKGLLMRRDKKLVDYARFRNDRDRSGKLDKKANEKIEQWEALNREAKVRLTKLIKLSWEITVSSYRHFAPIHVPWFEMITRNLAEAMSINATDLAVPDLERDFKADYDPVFSAAMNLGICNGTLALEVSNMITMNGADSPRQHSAWSNANKRSISINSEGSQDPYKRNSGNFYPSPLMSNGSEQNLSFGGNRLRAVSVASGQPKTPNFSGNVMSPQKANSPQLRPGTSPAPLNADLPAFAPRVSLDAPSPYIDLDSPGSRPDSGSTFFSASGAPSHQVPSQAPIGGGGVGISSIFSSAMPMSDSPISTRGNSFEQDQQYAHHGADSPALFTVASIYEFNIDRARSEAGWPYLTYTSGEIFDVIGEKGELWLSRNQDQPEIVGWIWNKHFMKLAA